MTAPTPEPTPGDADADARDSGAEAAGAAVDRIRQEIEQQGGGDRR